MLAVACHNQLSKALHVGAIFQGIRIESTLTETVLEQGVDAKQATER